MTTPYQRGASFERRVKTRLEKSGWWVARVAGSKGIADLVSIQKGGPFIYSQFLPRPRVAIIQCKKRGTKDLSKAERENLGQLSRFSEVYVVAPDGRDLKARAVDRWADGWEPFDAVF